jgi:hypothetical protein
MSCRVDVRCSLLPDRRCGSSYHCITVVNVGGLYLFGHCLGLCWRLDDNNNTGLSTNDDKLQLQTFLQMFYLFSKLKV